MTHYEVVDKWGDTLKSGSYEGDNFESFARQLISDFSGAVKVVACRNLEIFTID